MGLHFIYPYGENLYINLTNKCSNNCVFCIRQQGDGMGGYDLWLDREPSPAEVIAAIKGESKVYEEVVFCGFGEPLLRVEALLEISKWLKEVNYRVRINTNGQANLLHCGNILPRLQGFADALSISLNAHDATTYVRICRPRHGEEAYKALLAFAREAPVYVPDVTLTVLPLPGVDITRCRDIARRLQVKFRVRVFRA